MSSRRTLRRAAPAAALLLAGVAFFAHATRHPAPEPDGQDGAQGGHAAPPLAGVESAGRAGSRLEGRRRPAGATREPLPTLERDATPGSATGGGAPDASAAAASARAKGATAGGSLVPGAAQSGAMAAPKIEDFAIPAVPDRASAADEAAAVAPGRAPEIAFSAYVAAGAAAVDRVAEVVGERKPSLEEGVPVSLSGRVVESDGGLPVFRARVVVSSMFYVRGYFYDHHLREVASVETGADGGYRIERLNADPAHFGPEGRFYITVTAVGHAPALAIPLAAVSPGVANRLPDVALRRATQSLRGRVTDRWQGTPVVGARIYATGAISPVSYPKDERPALFVGAPTALTDAEGRFLLEGLGDGVQTISAYGGDDCVGWEVVALPFEGEFAMQTLPIRGRIEGTTVDERGDPVALVVVTGGDNWTHSFADGRFVLENFRGDVLTIVCTHADFEPVSVPDVKNGTTGLVVRLERRRPTIVIEVRDADTSAPIPRVKLDLTFADPNARPAPTSPQRLAADGRYPVRVPAGATNAVVSAEGRKDAQVSLAGRVDGESVTVLLARAAGP